MNASEREAIRAIIRRTPSYQKEAEFFKGANVSLLKVRLHALRATIGGQPTAAWMGSARLTIGKLGRTIRGHGRSALRYVGPNAGPSTSPPVPLAYGLDPAEAIRTKFAADAAKEVTVPTGQSPAQLAGFARRTLLRDCAPDILRLAAEIDAELLDPVRRSTAEQLLAAETCRAEAKARDERLRRFSGYLLAQAVNDGLEKEDLLAAFDNFIVEQVMES